MNTHKQITKRQLAVIDQLFKGELDQQAILDKYKVSHNLYQKWLVDKNFADELDRRIESYFRYSSILIARYAPLAASKLVQLTDSENPETARKACLDILQFQNHRLLAPESSPQTPSLPLPSETASRILSALAEQTNSMGNDDET